MTDRFVVLERPVAALQRIIAGRGAATANDILTLAIRVGEAATACQLRLVSIHSSRSAGSWSRYVNVRDRMDRPWLVRVSDHMIPVRNWHPLPHLDFVSRDGKSGLPDAARFLESIDQGSAMWFDPEDRAVRKAFRRQFRESRR